MELSREQSSESNAVQELSQSLLNEARLLHALKSSVRLSYEPSFHIEDVPTPTETQNGPRDVIRDMSRWTKRNVDAILHSVERKDSVPQPQLMLNAPAKSGHGTADEKHHSIDATLRAFRNTQNIDVKVQTRIILV